MKSYGITTKGRFQWLIRKGDLVLSTEQRSIYSDLFWFSSKTSPGKKFDVPIFVYLARDKDDDDVPKDWEDGQHGMLSSVETIMTTWLLIKTQRSKRSATFIVTCRSLWATILVHTIPWAIRQLSSLELNTMLT